MKIQMQRDADRCLNGLLITTGRMTLMFIVNANHPISQGLCFNFNPYRYAMKYRIRIILYIRGQINSVEVFIHMELHFIRDLLYSHLTNADVGRSRSARVHLHSTPLN